MATTTEKRPGDDGYKFVWIDRVQLARVTREDTKEAGISWDTIRRVAERLAHHGNGRGKSIHPGNDRLAYELDITERTLQRGLRFIRDVSLAEKVVEGQSHPYRRAAGYELRESAWLAERQPEPYKGDALDVALAGIDKGDAGIDEGDAGATPGRRSGRHPTNQLHQPSLTNHPSPTIASEVDPEDPWADDPNDDSGGSTIRLPRRRPVPQDDITEEELATAPPFDDDDEPSEEVPSEQAPATGGRYVPSWQRPVM